ncbi:bis(5'-nucleosyl)-tetraphosphatase [asymmetrical]-like isoform X2 [Homarus americanus]|uniref:bis(5'-nucleosyl)-tetraphosphatase [asymmetrical]-like isoform X2 n=1 Tax=Homarus americanus TaxID=6706 RepID=UPI001C44734D|nr:bis(5'-nucleosyl)-tetraphosphatase [asymmetrical]-like isoform X2 [Homarus americanus]
MSAAIEIRAAGLIIFRRVSTDLEYLLLKASKKEGHWTPPKGHVDPGETDKEAAIRETEEEAGLCSNGYTVIDSYQKVLKYTVKNKQKEVVYWPAELKDPSSAVKISDEHVEFRWAPLTEACSLVGFTDLVAALKECEEFLRKYFKN